MAATLLVTPATLGADRPVARVGCADCGAVLLFDVDSARLRRLVEGLARVHRCAVAS